MADSVSPPALPPTGPLAGAAWLLLGLTGALGFYVGLSALLLPFLGDPGALTKLERQFGPMLGLLQIVLSGMLVHKIRRRDMERAVFGAGVLLVISLDRPSLAAFNPGSWLGLDVHDGRLVANLVVLILAIFGMALSRRHPLAAALIVTLPTLAGVLGVLALAGMIAVHGF